MPTQAKVETYLGATPNPAAATREAMAVARSGAVPIVEIFYSLQGEGLRTGEPTVFIRSAGCNCDCWFCDTDFRVREVLSIGEVVRRVDDLSGGCRWACLTGGEPTIHDLGPLCDELHMRGYKIRVEASGGRPQAISTSTISPSPPRSARVRS